MIDVRQAAQNTLDLTRKLMSPPVAMRDEDARSTGHAIWILEEIIDGMVVRDKAHRWLGYAQALLVVYDLCTLEDMKQANLGARCD